MQEKFTSLDLSLNECKEKHICPVCGKECSHSYDSTKKKPKWKLFCSNDCKNSTLGKEIISFLFKQSMLEKYGVENPSQLEEVKLKKEQTSIKNFGVSNPMFSKEVKNKIKETFKEKYNVDCTFQIPEVAKKIEQYNLEHYGTKTRFENKEIRDLAEEKMRETYRNPEKLKKIKEKNKQSMLGRIKSKLKRSNQTVVLSKSFATTKTCSCCWEKKNIKLFDRVFKCERCGIEMDRDIHAAQNMIWFYWNVTKVPMERRDLKPVEMEASALLSKLIRDNASYISVKQEAAMSLA